MTDEENEGTPIVLCHGIFDRTQKKYGRRGQSNGESRRDALGVGLGDDTLNIRSSNGRVTLFGISTALSARKQEVNSYILQSHIDDVFSSEDAVTLQESNGAGIVTKANRQYLQHGHNHEGHSR